MGDLFRPRRRKIGAVTLVVACVFAAGWIRSLFDQESLNLPTGQNSSVQLISGRQSFSFVAISASLPDPRLTSIEYFRDDPDGQGPRVHLGRMRLGGPAGLFHLQFKMNSQT